MYWLLSITLLLGFCFYQASFSFILKGVIRSYLRAKEKFTNPLDACVTTLCDRYPLISDCHKLDQAMDQFFSKCDEITPKKEEEILTILLTVVLDVEKPIKTNVKKLQRRKKILRQEIKKLESLLSTDEISIEILRQESKVA